SRSWMTAITSHGTPVSVDTFTYLDFQSARRWATICADAAQSGLIVISFQRRRLAAMSFDRSVINHRVHDLAKHPAAADNECNQGRKSQGHFHEPQTVVCGLVWRQQEVQKHQGKACQRRYKRAQHFRLQK